MQKPLLLAIDGGGTKTEAVLCTTEGYVIAHCIEDASNPNSASANAADVFQRVCRNLGVNGSADSSRIAGVAIGLAGGTDPAICRDAEQALRLGCGKSLAADDPVLVTSDAFCALRSAIPIGAGAVLVAGTGSIFWGVDACDETFRVGGWGHLFSDLGGGYDIGRRALAAMMSAYDGIAPPTRLTQLILSHCAVGEPAAIIPVVYKGGKKIVASLAPLVFEAATQNDPAAKEIIHDAADCLADLLVGGLTIAAKRTVISHTETSAAADMPATPQTVVPDSATLESAMPEPAEAFPVALTGSLYKSPVFTRVFEQRLSARLTQCAQHPQQPQPVPCRLIRPSLPPVYGSACHLLQQLWAEKSSAEMQAYLSSFSQNFAQTLSAHTAEIKR